MSDKIVQKTVAYFLHEVSLAPVSEVTSAAAPSAAPSASVADRNKVLVELENLGAL